MTSRVGAGTRVWAHPFVVGVHQGGLPDPGGTGVEDDAVVLVRRFSLLLLDQLFEVVVDADAELFTHRVAGVDTKHK